MRHRVASDSRWHVRWEPVKQNDGPRQLLDVKKAAEWLGVSPFTVRAWLRQRRLEYVKLGRRVLVPEHAIRRFIAANTITSRDEDGP